MQKYDNLEARTYFTLMKRLLVIYMNYRKNKFTNQAWLKLTPDYNGMMGIKLITAVMCTANQIRSSSSMCAQNH